MRFLLAVSLLVCGTASTAFGWGEDGHKTIGAMVDKLITGTPAAEHVHALLGNETLSTASVWADVVKGRSNQTPEMIEFKTDNPHHYSFHYSDIPFEEKHYHDDSIGATNVDVVHAIPACILILQGKASEQNLYTNVTPRMALRLLVHYLEDLHQPLHVGAGYLDGTNFIDPNGYGKPYKDDKGGNELLYHTTNNLHTFWDDNVVKMDMTNAHAATPVAFARALLSKPAPDWKDTGPFGNWPKDWADESVVLSEKVHDVTVLSEENGYVDRPRGRPHTVWHTKDLTPEYVAWAEKTAEQQMTKAGYRIAAVLETIWPAKE